MTYLIVGTEEELQELTTTLERRARAYRIQISTEKSKIMFILSQLNYACIRYIFCILYRVCPHTLT